MLAVNIDGYSLLALIAILLAVVFVIVVVVRFAKREHDVRVTRVGVFVERQRFGGEDAWTPDPLTPSREQETRPAPIPPPTPPPPLPEPRFRPVDEDETEAWPQREESP